MLTQMAALGIGLITTVAAPAALAAPPCGPVYPTGGHAAPYPAYGAPVPAYSPAPPYAHAPAPPYAAPAPRRLESSRVVMRRADYNRDGGVTYAEAHAYGREQFVRADRDRNGVLTRSELRNSRDDFTRISNPRGGGVVTLAEFDASVYNEFYQLDTNRDGFLSRHELGTAAPSSSVTWSWNWSL